jgi:quercetin dioxygenase-like cupin family protein
VDKDNVKLIQVALHPGQGVPQHKTNGDVYLLVLDGELMINLNGNESIEQKGAIIPVGYDTPMNIQNRSEKDSTFLIIKTPAPEA